MISFLYRVLASLLMLVVTLGTLVVFTSTAASARGAGAWFEFKGAGHSHVVFKRMCWGVNDGGSVVVQCTKWRKIYNRKYN